MLSRKSSSKLKPGKDFIGVGGGALIVNEKGETLLIRRTSAARNDAGVWSQPGGTLDYGETVKEMVIREIKEELGVDIELLELLCYSDQILADEEQHWVAISFLAKISSGEPQNLEPHKHDTIKWFTFDKLPSRLSKPTQDAVKKYLDGKS